MSLRSYVLDKDVGGGPIFLLSPNGKTVAWHNSYGVAYAPLDCLFQAATPQDKASACWTRLGAHGPVSGLVLTDKAIEVRLNWGRGTYQAYTVDFGESKLRRLPSSKVKCAHVDVYIGGCDVVVTNTSAPKAYFGERADRRFAKLAFGFSASSKSWFGKHQAIDGCGASEICRSWPNPDEVAFVPSVDGNAAVPLIGGSLALTAEQRSRFCERAEDVARCQDAYLAPVVDAVTLAYIEPFEVLRPASTTEGGRVDERVSFIVRSDKHQFKATLVSSPDGSGRLLLESKGRRVERMVGKPPAGIPPETHLTRVRLGQDWPMNIHVGRPARAQKGTVVYFIGGPGGYVPLRHSMAEDAMKAGAVFVHPEYSGQAEIPTGAWSRLKAHGVAALENDIALLEAELADQARYPRPLVLVSTSFGFLPLRVAIERGKLKPEGVMLVAPMIGYGKNERSAAGLAEEAKSPATVGADFSSRARELSLYRNHVVHSRYFGFHRSEYEGHPFARWINAFDPCVMPAGTVAVVATNDNRVDASRLHSDRCDNIKVTTVRTIHDFVWAEPETNKALDSLFKKHF